MQKVDPASNETLGIAVLKSRSFFTEAYWYWIGVGGLVGFILLLNFLFTLALTYLNRAYFYPLYFNSFWNWENIPNFDPICAAFNKPQAIIPDESKSDESNNNIGGDIQLQTYGSILSHEAQSGDNSHLHVCVCISLMYILYMAF